MLFPALLARAAAAPYGNRRSPLEDFAGCRPGLWLRGRLCISGRSLALVGNTVLEPCFLRLLAALCLLPNQQISLGRYGALVTEENLLRMFDRLIEQGAHNLNLVNPTHYAPMLAKALKNTVRLCRLSIIQGDMSG